MKKEFGATKSGEKASCYVLKNSKGMEAVVSDFGASLLKLYVPDKDGKTQDVVLGYETLERITEWRRFSGGYSRPCGKPYWNGRIRTERKEI